jgi:cytochrome o ubiquinol oxidase subunit 3
MENHLVVDDHHHNSDATDIFGFWIYILSDCILFATIFAAFAVLRHSYYGNPDVLYATDISYVFKETLALLASSFTFGLGMIAMYRKNLESVIKWLGITFILGAIFIGMEVNEFVHLYHEGAGWQTSAAMSSFFTLVGTHGLHVTIGLLWIVAMMIQLSMFGINSITLRRMTYLGLFWAFLDIVWIFVFTIVYLMGTL